MQKTKDWSEMGKKDKERYHTAARGLYSSKIELGIDYKPPIVAKVKRLKRTHHERTAQMKLASWMRSEGLLFTAIPNGAKRSIISGQIEKAMGLTKGTADLFLAVPTKQWHGFWIEMKAPGKKPRPEQYEFLGKARANGYKAEYYDSYESAKLAIEQYLSER